MSDFADCSVADCERPADGEYCAMHKKRMQRGGDVTAPAGERLTPLARLEESAIQLADAEEDEDYERGKDRLRKAAMRAAAPAMGSRGGKARAAALTAERRSEIARLAAMARAAALDPAARRRIAKQAAQARTRHASLLGAKQAGAAPNAEQAKGRKP